MANIEQQIQELNCDIDEIKNFIGQAKRAKVKQSLEIQQRRFETELISLKEKQEKAKTSTGQSLSSSAATPATATRAYTKEISLYAWDQSDKFIKIYVQNLDGVGDLPAEQVRCSFEERGFTLEINNLKNVNYLFKRSRLLHDITPDKSTYKIKKDMIILSLAKTDSKNWECIFRDEKKIDKPSPKLDEGKDPGDSLMDLMKNMYENGDDEMKRTIAKAWTESREKMHTGRDTDPNLPGF